MGLRSGPGSIGIYNRHDSTSTLHEVFPAEASAGWFAVASFRPSPTLVVVNLFDETATLRSTRTYLGADRAAIGFYRASTQASVYSQDHRNPASAAKALFFRRTGINSGSAWLALESSAGTDSDQDFWRCPGSPDSS